MDAETAAWLHHQIAAARAARAVPNFRETWRQRAVSDLAARTAPSKAWLKIAHRFPEPPRLPGVGDEDHAKAVAIHAHVCSTMDELHRAIDRTTADKGLSEIGKRDQIAAHAKAAAAKIAALDDEARGPGLAAAILKHHGVEAATKAGQAIVMDPVRAPMLVNIADRLQNLPRDERVRVVSTSIAALAANPTDRSARDTLMTIVEWPHWATALPTGMVEEAAGALRQAVAPSHHATHQGITTLLDHTRQLRDGAALVLKSHGVTEVRGEASEAAE